jgi:hypothetical protein
MNKVSAIRSNVFFAAISFFIIILISIMFPPFFRKGGLSEKYYFAYLFMVLMLYLILFIKNPNAVLFEKTLIPLVLTIPTIISMFLIFLWITYHICSFFIQIDDYTFDNKGYGFVANFIFNSISFIFILSVNWIYRQIFDKMYS